MGVLFNLRSDGQYILLGSTVMAVFLLISILCDVLIDSGRPFLLKVRWKIYYNGDAVLAVFVLINLLCDVLISNNSSFLLKVRWKIYYTW